MWARGLWAQQVQQVGLQQRQRVVLVLHQHLLLLQMAELLLVLRLAWMLLAVVLVVVLVMVLQLVLQCVRLQGWSLLRLLVLLVVGHRLLWLLWAGAPAAVRVGPRTCGAGRSGEDGAWRVTAGSRGGLESSTRTVAAVLSPSGAPCILLLSGYLLRSQLSA